jgi:hypothetical protein
MEWIAQGDYMGMLATVSTTEWHCKAHLEDKRNANSITNCPENEAIAEPLHQEKSGVT